MSRKPYLVTKYGARSGRQSEDTKAIQTTIDRCAANGGGTVVFPAGEYVTAPVFLKDNVEIRIDAGATVFGARDLSTYPTIEGRWEGYEREVYASLFTGHDLSNVTITGRGTIDARGQPWWEAFEAAAESYELGRDNPYPSDIELEHPRPRVINIYDSDNVFIEGIKIENAPSWTLHFVYCEDVTVRDVTIRNPFETPNTDGINPDSSKNVLIEGCDISVGDDCIALKAGSDEEGRRIGEPCENITVSDCMMTGGYSGLGIGSETAGDIRNVTITNCIFKNLLSGIRIKSKRGRGGVVENLHGSSIICDHLSESAIELTMFYGGDDPSGSDTQAGLPEFDNFSFTDLLLSDVSNLLSITGLPDSPIRRVSLTGVDGKGLESLGTVKQAEQVRLTGIPDSKHIDDLVVTESTDVRVVS